jgi:uncharacterized protein (DUF58 family)
LKATGRGICLAVAGTAFLAAALVFERSDALLAAVVLFSALLTGWLCGRLARPPAAFWRTMTSGAVAPGARVEVRLTPVPGTGFIPDPSAVSDLTPWLQAEVSPDPTGVTLGYAFAAPGRGVYGVGPAVVTTLGPLGVVSIRHRTAPPLELVVAPRLVDVTVTPPDAESDLPQARSQTGAERVTEPAAVRDYQSGDPRRLVHWKATARRDRLMVREVVLRGLPQAWVLVDDAAPPGPPAEAALSVAASIAVRLLRSRHTVHLTCLAAPAARFEPTGGAAAVLEAFARIQLSAAPAAGVGQRLLGQIGARGAVAPIYGALAQVTPETLEELAKLAVVARPGQVWLAGAPEVDAELRRQGWSVSRIT